MTEIDRSSRFIHSICEVFANISLHFTSMGLRYLKRNLCTCPVSVSYHTFGIVIPYHTFGMTPTFLDFFFFFWKSRCHTKRRAGAAMRAHPSFGMTTSQYIRDLFVHRRNINPHCSNLHCNKCDANSSAVVHDSTGPTPVSPSLKV